MKKISSASILLAMSVFSSTIFADVELNSKEQVEGNWKLQYTKSSLTTQQIIKREDTWLMKDGNITISNIPHEGKHYDQPALIYSIENGKLKVPYLGRGGGDFFSLIAIDDKNMTLKGKFGEYYYFDKVAP
ncbi:conserved exported hypothetical protein [Crenothrix polyspora]|jgi:hypothetical protein|uniref:Lipocalin-like domain-containing protein n=1 Tax=Crenothrix polyspora TaxID=360316 RepID=A0A1R4H8Q0_9GAMM|nr:hypothetical protein [Crenothrix polyspora]SJM92648.1 conserved exported hypothetical protein [Crenothrix polyspora]